MGIRYDTENRTTQNARGVLVSRSRPFLSGLIFASTILVSCATPESLSDKEEFARLSGKGAVIGIHQGLGSIDDPVVNKIRAELLDDEVLQRKVAQLVQAAVMELGKLRQMFTRTKAQPQSPTPWQALWIATSNKPPGESFSLPKRLRIQRP